MLQPKITKYRRPFSLKYEGNSKAGNSVVFGDYGLIALEGNYITDKQIESSRVVLSNFTNRVGKVWIRIFPHLPKTRKPLVRMGSGKGNPEYFVAVVKKGKVLFEISGISEILAKKAFRLCSYKLPIKTKFIKKGEKIKL